MQVREKHRVDVTQRNAGLPQTDRDTAAGVEQQPLLTGLHERAWPEAVDAR